MEGLSDGGETYVIRGGPERCDVDRVGWTSYAWLA